MSATDLPPDPVSILGVNVTPFASAAQAAACIRERIRRGQKSFCVAINPEKVYRSRREPSLRAILDQADIGICDGIGVAWAVRLLHGKTIARCTGVDLCLSLLAAAARDGLKVFLLGADPDVNRRAAEKIADRFPGIRLVGRQDGYFRDHDAVVKQINDSQADLLFVAMGSPKQEQWIASHRSALRVPFCMGVGGTLDVISGRVRRAPWLFRRTGTEFLYRLFREPRRWRRQLALPRFALEVLTSLVRSPTDQPGLPGEGERKRS